MLLLLFTVTEYEIREGMPMDENCEQTCLTVVRHVDDLEEHVANPRAMRFIDVDPVTKKVNDYFILPVLNAFTGLSRQRLVVS